MTDDFEEKVNNLLPCWCSKPHDTDDSDIRCPAAYRQDVTAALRAEREASQRQLEQLKRGLGSDKTVVELFCDMEEWAVAAEKERDELRAELIWHEVARTTLGRLLHIIGRDDVEPVSTDAASALENEIACLNAENERLKTELESYAWEISPAMAQAKIDSLNAENERLTTENAALKIRAEQAKVAF